MARGMTVRQIFAAVVCASTYLTFAGTAWAIDTTWVSNSSGNWTDATRWSNGVPVNGSFNVFIDDGDSAVTVTLNESKAIGSLTVGINDKLKLKEGVYPNSFVELASSHGIVNSGTIEFASVDYRSALRIDDGEFMNTSTGLFIFHYSRFTGNLTNYGTVRLDWNAAFDKVGGIYSNYGQFTQYLYFHLANGGMFEQIDGLLDFNYPASDTVFLEGGSTLNLRGGETRLGSRIDGSGGTINQYGGTVTYVAQYIHDGTYNFVGGNTVGSVNLVDTA